MEEPAAHPTILIVDDTPNNLSLLTWQRCQRLADLTILKKRLSLFRDIHIGIRRFIQDGIAAVCANQSLRADIAPAISIDGKVACDPE